MDAFIAELFSCSVAVAHATIADRSAFLYPEEQLATQAMVPRRLAEYSTGRMLARTALSRLGAASCAIPSRADRTAVWPAHYTGSISHTGDLCIAAAARLADAAGIGVDVEQAALSDTRLYSHICRPEELAGLSVRKRFSLGEWVALTFSAKEAFYKAYFPLTRHFLELKQVRIHFPTRDSAADETFAIEVLDPRAPAVDGALFRGRWLRRDPWIFTGVSCLKAASFNSSA